MQLLRGTVREPCELDLLGVNTFPLARGLRARHSDIINMWGTLDLTAVTYTLAKLMVP
jgi:hypothetical protein